MHALRSALKSQFGAWKYRITQCGEVHVRIHGAPEWTMLGTIRDKDLYQRLGVRMTPPPPAKRGFVTPDLTIPIDEVVADKFSGQWFGKPRFRQEYTSRSLWAQKTGTEDKHFDTYEVRGQTRAIIVHWK
jgi:hypothetical protein